MSGNSTKTTELAALQRAALALAEMRAKVEALEYSRSEPIAIVGMACRFPADGAGGECSTPEAFWDVLHTGKEAIRDIPAERWDANAYYDAIPGVPGKTYTRSGAFLPDVDQFDPLFFGISPREASSMDPQQRLLLEVSWEALERAGYASDQLPRQTGIFIGMSETDYATLPLPPGVEADAYEGTGNDLCFASGRLAYFLGVHGPNIALDTACSSSLVASHLAAQSLRNDECELALVGGVHLNLSPDNFVALAQARALAPDGRCKTFDAGADGYGRGEGVGILVLKRLSKAIHDNDNILALLRGSAVNHDGASSGLTVPNKLAQEALMQQALKNAGVSPQEVSYVEAHGTGTPLGDPIEVRALATVYGQERKHPLLIGSVKTNIGHLEGAAGIAGMIKVVLSLQNGVIPPHLNFREPNPYLDWASLPLTVPTQNMAWPTEKRLAGVSSFGLSGTNAHIILEAAPAQSASPKGPPPAEAPRHLFTLSAKTDQALATLAKRYASHLAAHPQLELGDVCATANTGRTHFDHRLSMTATTTEDLVARLTAFGQGLTTEVATGHSKGDIKPKVAFLFTGQGAQYVNMGRGLYMTQPVFRTALDRCDEILRSDLGTPLLDLLFPPPGQSDSDLLDQTAYTQPALFALEYGLTQLWLSWGIEPAALMGHSVGEYVAACIAGVFSLEDGLRLVAARGRLMQALPQNGAMMAVLATPARVEAFLAPHGDGLSIAAINGPESVVISGEKAAIDAVASHCQSQGVKTRALIVSHAFHSALMEPILAEFTQIAHQIAYKKPRLRLVSNLTGQFASDEVATPDYWVRHIRQPVQFAAGIATLQAMGCHTYLEIGPQPILLGMGRQCIEDGGEATSDTADSVVHSRETLQARPLTTWLPSLRKGQDEWQPLLASLGQLYVQGARVKWPDVDVATRRKVVLPTYPFQRQPYWLRQRPTPMGGDSSRSLAQMAEQPHWREWLYTLTWESQSAVAPIGPQDARPREGCWLVFAEPGGVGEQLAASLRAHSQTAILVTPGSDATQKLADQTVTLDPTDDGAWQRLLQTYQPCQGIVYLWGVKQMANTATIQTLAEGQCGPVLSLVQTLSSLKTPPRLWLVTRGAQAALPGEMVQPAQAPLWGLGRTIALEQPELRCTCIDLPIVSKTDADAQLLCAHLLAADGLEIEGIAADHENQLALRGGQGYVARLVRAKNPQQPHNRRAFNILADSNYLITGGLGGLGLSIAKALADQGARHLTLLSRSGAASAEAQAAVDALKSAGVEVMVCKADVADADALGNALTQSRAIAPLRGVIHAAGILDDAILLNQNASRLARVMHPKVQGAWNLHTLTQADELDFFVCFSSVAALLGSVGQGNYAAANAFLDALAHFRQANDLPAQSIQWGPWAEVGMAARTGPQTARNSGGLHFLNPQEGARLCMALLHEQWSQVGVLPIDDQAAFRRQTLPSLWLSTTHSLEPDSVAAYPVKPLIETLAALPENEAWETLQSVIDRQVTDVLGLGNGLHLDPTQRLFEVGFDSLMAVELRSRLQSVLGCMLPSTLVFDYPSVNEMTRYVQEELLADSATPVENETDLSLPDDALNSLSEQELEALLMQKIANLVETQG